MAADDLYLAASELLDACVLILDAETTGAPTTRYVTPGEPADDCDMLTVNVDMLSEQDTIGVAGQRHRFRRVNEATFVVRLVRCVPTSRSGGAPETPEQLEASAAMLLADIWALWNGLMRMKRDDILLNSFCSELTFERAQPILLSGEIGGWTLSIRAVLNGYSPALGTP
jgi:hypothetical protein